MLIPSRRQTGLNKGVKAYGSRFPDSDHPRRRQLAAGGSLPVRPRRVYLRRSGLDHQPHRLCRNRHRGAVVHLAAVYREKGD